MGCCCLGQVCRMRGPSREVRARRPRYLYLGRHLDTGAAAGAEVVQLCSFAVVQEEGERERQGGWDESVDTAWTWADVPRTSCVRRRRQVKHLEPGNLERPPDELTKCRPNRPQQWRSPPQPTGAIGPTGGRGEGTEGGVGGRVQARWSAGTPHDIEGRLGGLEGLRCLGNRADPGGQSIAPEWLITARRLCGSGRP